MNATPTDQKKLLDIADVDNASRQAENLRRNPPQAARIGELVAERTVLSHELATRAGARDDLQAELARIESDVKVVQARRDRDISLLAAVTNAKDATGLEHELASLAKRLSDLEDGQLQLMESIETADAAVAEQEAVIAATNAEGAALSAEAKKVVEDATARLSALARDRAALSESVPADLLALFDSLSARSGGAALLRARTCHGCNMQLSGNDLQIIRTTAADVVVTCPECGCILVRTSESGL